MNGDEAGMLLGLMALADNRKPPEDDEGRQAMIGLWLSMIGDLAYADAARAVQDHYRDTRDWIMPADIRRRVKAIRSDRIRHAVIPAPPAELADSPVAYKAAMAELERRAGDGEFPVAAPGTLAITGAPPAAVRASEPGQRRLGAAIGELRRALGPAPARRPRSWEPQAVAAEQATDARDEAAS